MQKTIIDTNVIVSSLIQYSYPFLIMDELFLEDKIRLYVSEDLMQEYFDVLHRPKFKRYPDFIAKAENILIEIGLKAELVVPKVELKIISDNSDNRLLELAEECNAEFLITGNTNDFQITTYKNTKILTPKEYWENYKP